MPYEPNAYCIILHSKVSDAHSWQVTKMDKSGICSQSGFVFQTKVFLALAASLKPDESLHYEYLDALEKSFDPLMATQFNDFRISQVKHTDVTKRDVAQIFTNWQMAYCKNANISDFALYIDGEHKVSPFFDTMDEEAYIAYIKTTASDHASSLAAKALIELGEHTLRENFSYISNRKTIIRLSDVKKTIELALSHHLHLGSVEETVYQQRCEDLEGKLLSAIADSMLHRKPYQLTHDSFMNMCEKTCVAIRIAGDPPSFSSWRARHPTKHLSELEDRREIVQLRHCFDDTRGILEHYYYGEYYQDLRFQRYESGNMSLAEDIEATTYANHRDVVEELNATGTDTPISRLLETKKRDNSHCKVNQERWGSCIYLTKDQIAEWQISWKEEAPNG